MEKNQQKLIYFYIVALILATIIIIVVDRSTEFLIQRTIPVIVARNTHIISWDTMKQFIDSYALHIISIAIATSTGTLLSIVIIKKTDVLPALWVGTIAFSFITTKIITQRYIYDPWFVLLSFFLTYFFPVLTWRIYIYILFRSKYTYMSKRLLSQRYH